MQFIQKGKLKGIMIEEIFHSKSVTEKRNNMDSEEVNFVSF